MPCALSYLKGVAAGDFDGDGDIDLITGGRYAQCLSIFLNAGDGTFASAQDVEHCPAQGTAVTECAGQGWMDSLTPSSIKGLDVADFNHDGHLDLFFFKEYTCDSPNGDSRLFVQLGDGTGSFGPRLMGPPSSGTGACNYQCDVKLGDVDSDGWMDIVEVIGGGTIQYYLNPLGHGASEFTVPTSVSGTVGTAGGDVRRYLVLGDFTRTTATSTSSSIAPASSISRPSFSLSHHLLRVFRHHPVFRPGRRPVHRPRRRRRHPQRASTSRATTPSCSWA